MIHISLSYFDMILGPRPFLCVPTLDNDADEKFAKFLDNMNVEGWCEYTFDEYKTSCYYFEINSELARGNSELLLLSIIFPKDEVADFPKKHVIQFIKWIKAEPEIYFAFHGYKSKGYNKQKKVQAEEKIELEIGELLDKINNDIRKQKKGSLLIIGIDQVGKTTLIKKFKENLFDKDIKPTLGFQIIKLVIGNLDLRIYDAPGQKKLRYTWWKQNSSWDGIIFVTDITNGKEKLKESQEIFDELISNYYSDSKKTPLLIIGNKIDKADPKLDVSLLKQELIENFDLSGKAEHYKHIIMSAKTGENVQKGFRWVFGEIIKL